MARVKIEISLMATVGMSSGESAMNYHAGVGGDSLYETLKMQHQQQNQQNHLQNQQNHLQNQQQQQGTVELNDLGGGGGGGTRLGVTNGVANGGHGNDANLISEMNTELLGEKIGYHSTCKVPPTLQLQAPTSSSSSSAAAASQSRYAGEDNYMLKSCDSSRPRSASLSQIAQSRIHSQAASSASASQRVAVVAPLSQPPSYQAEFLLQEVANCLAPVSPAAPLLVSPASASTAGYGVAALLCACAPTCCCKCTLLSSLSAECQSVFHHACARYISGGGGGADPLSASASAACSPGVHDAAEILPPPTVPQDVVSPTMTTTITLFLKSSFLYFLNYFTTTMKWSFQDWRFANANLVVLKDNQTAIF